MSEQGHAVQSLHGGMTSQERDNIMDDFRRGEFKVLITTNVLARGIDILQVSLVVNYDMPLDGNNMPDPEAYLHRIGRTGRFGRVGVSINFVHDKRSWEHMRFMEEHFKRTIERVPTDDWEEVERILKPAL
jgi:ATP-dependent RNA helicase DDX19/DBP5